MLCMILTRRVGYERPKTRALDVKNKTKQNKKKLAEQKLKIGILR